MQICQMFVDVIEWVVRTIIEVVRTIIETVCGWVTSIIRTVVEVVKEVCSWLPWPLDQLCDLVTELVEVVTEVFEWICEEVITTIIDIVEAIITFIIYIIRWVCWIIDWPLRLIDILFCVVGVRLRRRLHVCVRILTDDEGTAATTREAVLVILERTDELLDQCSIDLCIHSVDFVRKADLMTGVECGVSQFFSTQYPWFERSACPRSFFSAIKPLTLYFVDSMAGTTNACTISRTSYVVLTDGANGASVVHEFGHHADLQHRDETENIMFGSASDTKDELTSWQCCMMRSSNFVSQIGVCFTRRGLGVRVGELRAEYVERAASRKKGD